MNHDHIVRPRRVWAGLVLALLGACGIAVWVAMGRLGAGAAGVALLGLGGTAALRGGILYDTHGGRPLTGEINEVRSARVHRGTAPGDMIEDARLRQEARETSRVRDALLQAAQDAPRPAFDALAALLLLVGAAFLVTAQVMYPHTHTGQRNATRSLLLAVVVILAALRILLAQRPGRIASGLAALAGVLLIVFAAVTDHDRTAMAVLEAGVGAWIVLASLLSLDRRRPRSSAPQGAVSEIEYADQSHGGTEN